MRSRTAFGRRTALVAGALVQAVGYACWVVFPGLPGLRGRLRAVGPRQRVRVGCAGGAAARRAGRSGCRGALRPGPGLGGGGGAGRAGADGRDRDRAVRRRRLCGGRVGERRDLHRHGRCGGPATRDTAARSHQRSHSRRAARPAEPDRRLCRSCRRIAEPSYLATLRAGVGEVATRPPLLRAVLAFGLLYGLDAFEEYFPLVARDLQISTAVVPAALLAVPLVGALGAALGGPANRLGAGALAAVLATGAVLLALAAAVPHPVALGGVALFYGLYRAVLVVADARLQERITGPARATVTSVANVVAELPVVRGLRGVGAGRHGGDDGAGRGGGGGAAGAAAARRDQLAPTPNVTFAGQSDRLARTCATRARQVNRGVRRAACRPPPSAAGPAACAAVRAARGSGRRPPAAP